MKTTLTTCSICNEPFNAPIVVILGVSVTAQVCNDCDDLAETAWAKRKAEVAAMSPDKPLNRAEQWAKIATDAGFARYAAYDAARCAATDALAHDGGMVLYGPTGRGKTFLAVECIRRQFMAGNSVCLVDGIEFGNAVSGLDGDRRDAMLNQCIKADWLLFDDLLKKKTTDRVAEGLFHVANRRENFERHTIWTTNWNDKGLRANLEPGYAEPFLERLYRTSRAFLL